MAMEAGLPKIRVDLFLRFGDQSGVFIFKDVFKKCLFGVERAKGAKLVDSSVRRERAGKRVSKDARLLDNG